MTVVLYEFPLCRGASVASPRPELALRAMGQDPQPFRLHLYLGLLVSPVRLAHVVQSVLAPDQKTVAAPPLHLADHFHAAALNRSHWVRHQLKTGRGRVRFG